MRLFIAAELPDTILDALSETSADLRESVRGRYVSPDLFHVTLAFLGDVEASRVSELEEVLDRACCGNGPFATSLGELGHFGRANDAVLWQGFTDPRPFKKLAADVREELRHAGFEYDTKSMKAHVTLMRRADVAAVGTLPMPHIAAGTVDSISLFLSERRSGRLVYEPLYTVEL